MSTVIGIDLGTTYSCVGVYRKGRVEIIPDHNGNRKIPSCIAYTETGYEIGDDAMAQAETNPSNTIFGVTRMIGESDVRANLHTMPFKYSQERNMPKFWVENKNGNEILSPEAVSSMILGRMKQLAEEYLKEPVKDAVITVPAQFSYSQRELVKEAGANAGLNVLRVISSSTAAAINYGMITDRKHMKETTVLALDVGGGTCDVSILNIDGECFEVKSTSGNSRLGGEDFTSAMVRYFVSEFNEKHGKDLTSSSHALARLRSACELAKRTLSFLPEASIDISALFEGIDFKTTITRSRFEELCCSLFFDIKLRVGEAVYNSKLGEDKIDEMVLVGGSSRIPKIHEILSSRFPGKKLNTSIKPEEAGAYGAAIQGAIICGDRNLKDVMVLDVTPKSLGIGIHGTNTTRVVRRNFTIPTSVSRVFTKKQIMGWNQQNVVIEVIEGEEIMTKDNTIMGKFELTGVTTDDSEIEVIFDLDADGGLRVEAVDKSSGRSSQLTVINRKRRSSDSGRSHYERKKRYGEEDEVPPYRRRCGRTA